MDNAYDTFLVFVQSSGYIGRIANKNNRIEAGRGCVIVNRVSIENSGGREYNVRSIT